MLPQPCLKEVQQGSRIYSEFTVLQRRTNHSEAHLSTPQKREPLAIDCVYRIARAGHTALGSPVT